MIEESIFLYTGYIMDYLSPDKIIKWADRKISSNYNDALLEISLSKGKANIIISALKSLCQEEISSIHIYYLSLYNNLIKNGIIKWDLIGKEMNKLYTREIITKEEDKDFFFSRLYDYYELQESNFSTNMNMPNELILFLSNFNENIDIFKKLEFNVKGININSL